MRTNDPELNPAGRTCASCGKASDETLLSHSEYRCPGCGFEMAHLDVAPNGSIRGIFGYLKTVGEVIQDRYRIERVLGKGGFGATYLVEDQRLRGKRRALKEVPELLFDEHEVNVLTHLRHPAIPDITDRFVSEGMIYLVLEFGGRRTLETQCQAMGGRIPLAAALPWMRQLCDVLIHLHSQNPPIIHRDLKPENVLLDDSDFIMLIDFGIAKVSASAATTRLMAQAASHGFSPPEQVMGTGTDERSDIYSFGATFYYLLTGKIPLAAHERVAGMELQAPSALAPGLPPELDEILLSTLSLNFNQRPSSVEDLRIMLGAVESSAAPEMPQTSRTVRVGAGAGRITTAPPGASLPGIRITTAEPIPPKTEGVKAGRKRRYSLVLAVAIPIVAVLAGGAYFMSGKKPPPPEVTTQPPPLSAPGNQPGVASVPVPPSVGSAGSGPNAGSAPASATTQSPELPAAVPGEGSSPTPPPPVVSVSTGTTGSNTNSPDDNITRMIRSKQEEPSQPSPPPVAAPKAGGRPGSSHTSRAAPARGF
jgi:eukaryotic-like serine/threonine-protein kinase